MLEGADSALINKNRVKCIVIYKYLQEQMFSEFPYKSKTLTYLDFYMIEYSQKLQYYY